jgi:hypothetical protein
MAIARFKAVLVERYRLLTINWQLPAELLSGECENVAGDRPVSPGVRPSHKYPRLQSRLNPQSD